MHAPQPPRNAQTIRIRPLVSSDLAEVLRIERESFDNPLSRDELVDAMRNPSCQLIVAELRDWGVVGYASVVCARPEATLGNLVVAHGYRRRMVGSYLLGFAQRIAEDSGAYRLVAALHEPNLIGQLFLASGQFRCTSIEPEFFDEEIRGSRAAYLFHWRATGAATAEILLKTSAAPHSFPTKEADCHGR